VSELAQRAKRVPILADLDESDRDGVLEECEEASLPSGTRLFTEGEAGGGLWWLLEGRVRVTSARHGLDAELGAGAALGALALAGAPRRATVETASRCTLLRLGDDGFRRLAASDAPVACRLLECIAREAARLVDEDCAAHPLGVDPPPTGD
jgi:CRP-like cAMP-binding protein